MRKIAQKNAQHLRVLAICRMARQSAVPLPIGENRKLRPLNLRCGRARIDRFPVEK